MKKRIRIVMSAVILIVGIAVGTNLLMDMGIVPLSTIVEDNNGNEGDDSTDDNTPYILNDTWWIGDANTGVKAEGKNGVDVKDAYVNDETHLIIVLNDNTEIDAGYISASGSVAPLEKFTVTFKDYDGTVLKTEEVESGRAAMAPDKPYRDGYVFTGWNQPFSNVISDMVAIAQYQKITAPTIMVSNAVASAGESAQVTISLMNNPGIMTLMSKVSFDENILKLDSIKYNSNFGGVGTKPQKFNSPVNIVWDDSADHSTNDVLVTLTFTVNSSATAGTVSDVNISYNAGDICNFNEDDVNFSIINGKVTVK